jgi:hypothetical protein
LDIKVLSVCTSTFNWNNTPRMPIKNVRLIVIGPIMKAPFLEEQSTFSSVTHPSFEEFSCKTVHLTFREFATNCVNLVAFACISASMRRMLMK